MPCRQTHTSKTWLRIQPPKVSIKESGIGALKADAFIGVSDHGGWPVLVTVAADGTFLDRLKVELVDEGLPKIPHHSEAQTLPPDATPGRYPQTLPMDEAVALVEQVRASAERRASLC